MFIVNETLNETRRNTQKLFSHHERNCSTKLFYKQQKTVRPSGEEGLVRGHVKKLLSSRYTVAQSVASCLLARHITPSVPRHAIGMPSASRHITKGGVGRAEGVEVH